VSRDRGLSPVVGKTLELGVGVLFVVLLTAMFFGGVVPEYRTAVGDEIGDRALVAGAERVEAAVPDGSYPRVDRRVAVRLPPAIRGDPYRIVAERGSGTDSDAETERGSGTNRDADSHVAALALVHPDPRIGGRVRLAVPRDIEISGSWTSASPSRVVVRDGDGGLSVRLEDGDASIATTATAVTSATTAAKAAIAAPTTATTTPVDRTPEVAA
jgi:hypothetical protein